MPATLLIVDDEPRIFGALRRALHREPLRLLHAGSGEEALNLLATEPVDVILADENMPGMNGSRLLAEVSRRWPRTVRMMLTGTADMAVVCKAVNEGRIARIFTKPCNEAELIIAIRDAIDEGGSAAGWPGTAGTTRGLKTTTPATPAAFGSTELHDLERGDSEEGTRSSTLRLVDDDGELTERSGAAAVIELDDADDVAGIMADLDQLDRSKH